MRGWVGVVLSASTGCFPASSAGPTGSSSSSGSTTSSATQMTSLATGPTASATTVTGPATTSTTAPGTGGSTSSSSGESTSDPGGPPGDCAAVLAEMPGAPDGIYELTIPEGDDAGTTFMAYCDNTIEGGGWTLVARSATLSGRPSFGWGMETGAVDDDDAPYSLDAVGKQLQFSEVLLGDYARGKQWGTSAYKKLLPDDFVVLYAAAPFSAPSDTVLGGCEPVPGPSGLEYIGFTDLGTIFALAGEEGDVEHGLGPGGWDTGFDDCGNGGDLNGLPGMIFVR